MSLQTAGTYCGIKLQGPSEFTNCKYLLSLQIARTFCVYKLQVLFVFANCRDLLCLQIAVSRTPRFRQEFQKLLAVNKGNIQSPHCALGHI